jgi:hypothetical protein
VPHPSRPATSARSGQFATTQELVSFAVYEQDPQADGYAWEDETKDGLINLDRRVEAFADQTIE